MGKNKKKFTLTSRWFTVIVCTLLLGANVGLGLLIMDRSKASMTQQMHTRMIDIAEVAAASVDGDVFNSITEEDYYLQSENYCECYQKLVIYQRIAEVKYIYAVRRVENAETGKASFVFIVDPDPESPAECFKEEVVYTVALDEASQGRSSSGL